MPITEKDIREGRDVTKEVVSKGSQARIMGYATHFPSHAEQLNAERTKDDKDVLGDVLNDPSRQAFGSHNPQDAERRRAIERQLEAEKAAQRNV
jgi:hypothetical protein